MTTPTMTLTPQAVAVGASTPASLSATSGSLGSDGPAQPAKAATRVDLAPLMKKVWQKALEQDQKAGEYIAKGIKRSAEQDVELLKSALGAAKAVWTWVRNLLLRIARLLGYSAAIPAKPTNEQLMGDEPISAELAAKDGPASTNGDSGAPAVDAAAKAPAVSADVAKAALLGEASRLIDHILEGGPDLPIPDISKPDIVQAHLEKLAAFRTHYEQQADAAEQSLNDSIRPHSVALGVEFEAFKSQLLHEQAGALLGGPSAESLREQVEAIAQLRAAAVRAQHAAEALMAAVEESADDSQLESVKQIRTTFDELFAGRGGKELDTASSSYNAHKDVLQNDQAGASPPGSANAVTKDPDHSGSAEQAQMKQAEQSPLVAANAFASLNRGRIKVPGDSAGADGFGGEFSRDRAS